MASVDLVIPVYNEEHVLAGSIARALGYLEGHPEHRWRIVVADNASRDRTLQVAREQEAAHPGRVVVLHLSVKGRGIALRSAWLTSDADVVAYMDVDLSTDLGHLATLVDPIARGEVDVAYGCRLGRGAVTNRSFKREFISRTYVFILNWALGLRVTDAQCGFKALSCEAARALVPLVHDNKWFFDSELLWVAQQNGFRLREVPVRWIEDPDTRVKVVQTTLENLRGIWRLRRHPVPRVPRRAASGGTALK
ncbi:MAG: glycosyltransferase family 2 protein [Dehalococcoidia bacterium]|nr:glycosyltransferase family 2 protein [Dehalococcoidia bacterium]